MSLTAWRIVKQRHAASAFTGEGARRYGGRWNSPVRRMVYASGTQALAILETLVHLQPVSGALAYTIFRLDLPENLVEVLPASRQPAGWNDLVVPRATQEIGDEWLARNRTPVLAVPSVLAPDEKNYLLNPDHADFARISRHRGIPFSFDPRLL